MARVQIPASTPYVGLEFLVGSLPCSTRFFSGHYCFPSTQKPTSPNSSSTKNQVDEEPLALTSRFAISKSLFMVIHSLFYLFTFTMVLENKGRQKKKTLTLPYSLVDATWIVGPGNLPVLRTGINGT